MAYYYHNAPDEKPPERKRNILSIVLVISVIALAVPLIGMLVLGWGGQNQEINTQEINTSEIDISNDPIQIPYTGEPIIKESRGHKYTITPVATYEISAKVGSVKAYNDDKVSPMDICVAWGELAAESNISYTQSGRFCSPELIGELKNRENYRGGLSAYKHSNNHIIPANNSILRALNTIRVGDKITLKGFLVNVDGRYWRTSLSRYDTGDGACEIIYVTEVRIGNSIWK